MQRSIDEITRMRQQADKYFSLKLHFDVEREHQNNAEKQTDLCIIQPSDCKYKTRH